MKQLSLVFLFIVFATAASAQLVDPVKWSYAAVKQLPGTYDLTLTAAIDEGWHIYSQSTGKGGPAPVSIIFKPNPLVNIKKGLIKEIGQIKKETDKTFGKPIEIVSLLGNVRFVHPVSLKAKVKTNIAGVITYEACNDNRCAQFKTTFDLLLD